MRRVQQREDWDCGVAALAMVTGASYDGIRARFEGSNMVGKSFTLFQIDPCLYEYGYAAARVFPWELNAEEREEWPVKPFAMKHIVLTTIGGGGHYVAMDGWGIVTDPKLTGERTLDDYDHVQWIAGVVPLKQT